MGRASASLASNINMDYHAALSEDDSIDLHIHVYIHIYISYGLICFRIRLWDSLSSND